MSLIASSSQAAGPPPAPVYVERPEADLFLLAVKLDHQEVADSLPSYPTPGGALVPLGQLADLLGLAIQVDASSGVAQGFVIEEGRGFYFDAREHRAVVEGKVLPVPAGMVEVHQDDLYVDNRLLSALLPIEFDVDLRAAVLNVRPRELLPMQRQKLRQAQLARNLAAVESPHYPEQKVPYTLLDGPFFDQTLNVALWKQQPITPDDLQYTTRLSGELLGGDAFGYLTGTGATLTDARFLLGRQDPEASLLGPLHATQADVGEVFFPGLDLIAIPYSGPGAAVGNFPLEQATQFDRTAFRGELPPGWEVELYQNDVLLAYQQSRPDGQYELLDVPLLFGANVFRLVFYGPQGQRREEVHTYRISDQLTPAGQVRYRLIANEPQNLGRRAMMETDVGLMQNLSANAAFAVLDPNHGALAPLDTPLLERYGKLGLRGFWRAVDANLDFVSDLQGGYAAQAGLRTGIGPWALVAQDGEFYHFNSEALQPLLEPLLGRTSLRLDGRLPLFGLTQLPFTLQVRHDRLSHGDWLNVISSRLSVFWRGLAVSNQLDWTYASRRLDYTQQALGTLLVSDFISSTFDVRLQADYRLAPTVQPVTTSVTAEARVLPGYLLALTLLRSGPTNRATVAIGKNQGLFGWTLTADYAQPTGLTVMLSLAFSMGRDSRTDDWHLQAQPMASTGAASIRAFLDTNGNGVFDPGEQPLPNVGFTVNRTQYSQTTDDTGVTFLPNLPGYHPSDLSVVTNTLEDPFTRPEREGVHFVPRPGKTVVVDMPIQVLGEIVGTVYLRREGQPRPLGGVELDLINGQGAIVTKVKSAYDGFFDITQVPPGHYTLRPEPRQLSAHGLALSAGHSLVMAPSGTVLEGEDFVLEPLRAP